MSMSPLPRNEQFRNHAPRREALSCLELQATRIASKPTKQPETYNNLLRCVWLVSHHATPLLQYNSVRHTYESVVVTLNGRTLSTCELGGATPFESLNIWTTRKRKIRQCEELCPQSKVVPEVMLAKLKQFGCRQHNNTRLSGKQSNTRCTFSKVSDFSQHEVSPGVGFFPSISIQQQVTTSPQKQPYLLLQATPHR